MCGRLNRYVSNLGGTVKLIADFGAGQLKITRMGEHGTASQLSSTYRT